jgi:hypothetical protein
MSVTPGPSRDAAGRSAGVLASASVTADPTLVPGEALMFGNMWRALCGACRQSVPPMVTCETFWPAPKQSNTVQPGKPFSRRTGTPGTFPGKQ